MNNLYKKLNKESDHIRLTADEKSAMRRRVFGAPSPVIVVRSPYVFFASHRFLTALAALVLVVFAGSSTVYAAQGALPGAPLYGLKTNVLERVEVALAATPAQKARVETHIASRRVAEAQELAAQGRLDATTTQELEDNFNAHAAQALALAAENEQATASTTLTPAVAEPRPKSKSEDRGRRAATTLSVTAMLATATPQVASTTEEETTAATTTATSTPGQQAQKESEDIHTSIEKQRGIFKEIKAQVEERRVIELNSEDSQPQTQ